MYKKLLSKMYKKDNQLIVTILIPMSIMAYVKHPVVLYCLDISFLKMYLD